MQFIKPIPFTDAIDKLGRKSIIGSSLNSEQWSRVPLALRERAFFSATIESTRFLQRARDSIGDFLSAAREEITLPDGSKTTAIKTGSRADFVKQTQDFAYAEGMGPIDPKHVGTIRDIRTEKRLGLIFDTQVRQAQDYGWWKQGQDPAVLDAYPAQRFIREREVKQERDYHRFHENEVQLKSDLGFWKALNRDFGVPWGPWGWGCGHDVEDVDREEAERLGLIAPGERAKPVEQEFNDELEASVRGLDDDMRRSLADAFGDQIQIDGDNIQWKGGTHERTQPQTRVGRSESRREPDQASDLARRVSEAARGILEGFRSGDTGAPLAPQVSQGGAASLGAVANGRKPLYHEEFFPGEAEAVAEHLRSRLPRSVQITAKENHLYAYRPDVVQRVVDAAPDDYPGDSLFEKIERATLSGTNGQLLGYGAWTMLQPGRVLVTIFDPAKRPIFGFYSLRESAERYAIERTKDFTDAFGPGYTFKIS